MSARSIAVGALCLALSPLTAPAGASWIAQTVETFEAEASRRHPRSKTLVFQVPVDAPRGAEVCFTYAHWREDQPDRGAVKVRATLTRQASPSGPVILLDEIRFPKVAIEERSAIGCAFTAGLEAGDIARFGFRFIRPPRLLVGGESGLEARFQLSGSVSFRE